MEMSLTMSITSFFSTHKPSFPLSSSDQCFLLFGDQYHFQLKIGITWRVFFLFPLPDGFSFNPFITFFRDCHSSSSIILMGVCLISGVSLWSGPHLVSCRFGTALVSGFPRYDIKVMPPSDTGTDLPPSAVGLPTP